MKEIPREVVRDLCFRFTFMKKLLLSLVLLATPLFGTELKVSPADPLVVTAAKGWTGAQEAPRRGFPFATLCITPPNGRNAECLITLMDRSHVEFKDSEFLKRLLQSDSRPYLANLAAWSKVQVKSLKVRGGIGFYVNFTDPDLAGKPAKKGDYKIATPIYFSLGSDYLLKATILCDDVSGADYSEALAMVESIHVQKPAL